MPSPVPARSSEHAQAEVALRQLRQRRTRLQARAIAQQHVGGLPSGRDVALAEQQIRQAERALTPLRQAHLKAVMAATAEPCRFQAVRALAAIAAVQEAVDALNILRGQQRDAGAHAPALDCQQLLVRLKLPLKQIAERKKR